MLYSLDDFVIIPSITSKISSRSECNPYREGQMYPLITAPMSSVIDENNWKAFRDAGVYTIIPRSVDFDIRLNLMHRTMVAMSLKEFEAFLFEYDISKLKSSTCYICVDIANGHMEKLLDLCERIKRVYGNNIVLMAGNIANPLTYSEYAKVGIDLIRCSIGSGNCCITSCNSSVHYPAGSLLKELVHEKEYVEAIFSKPDQSTYKSVPKIVMDGGFKNFDQIIKALAMGADFVMLGNIFAKTLEACGEIFTKAVIASNIVEEKDFQEFIRKQPIDKVVNTFKAYREYYGMSTKRAQKEISGDAYKTSEGIQKEVDIEYTLNGWLENFSHYLRSAMSYCNSRNLNEFSKRAVVELISPSARIAYYK